MKERIIGCTIMMIVGVLAACLGATLSLGERITNRARDELILWLSIFGGCLCLSGAVCAMLIITEVI